MNDDKQNILHLKYATAKKPQCLSCLFLVIITLPTLIAIKQSIFIINFTKSWFSTINALFARSILIIVHRSICSFISTHTLTFNSDFHRNLILISFNSSCHLNLVLIIISSTSCILFHYIFDIQLLSGIFTISSGCGISLQCLIVAIQLLNGIFSLFPIISFSSSTRFSTPNGYGIFGISNIFLTCFKLCFSFFNTPEIIPTTTTTIKHKLPH
eukprot:3478_1